jgi:ribonuclease D
MLIDSQKEADRIFDSLNAHNFVAIDSEFHWTRTYDPIAALLQVNDGKNVHLIDLKALKDFSSMKVFLENTQCTKILHSCVQDLYLFNRMAGIVTKNIYDSQIAYAFCNPELQISYGGMVENLTGEVLSKGSQRSDWLRRPLSPKQLEYAANDVIWLRDCFLQLREKLDKLGRSEWLTEECSQYENPNFYKSPEDQFLYRHMKGAGRMKREQLAILRELSYQSPMDTHELKHCDDIPPKVMQYNSRDIIKCVEIAKQLKPDQLPDAIDSRTPSGREEKFTDAIFAAANTIAEANGLSPNLLITKQVCRKIAAWTFQGLGIDFTFMSSWRQTLLKDIILELAEKYK